MTRTAAQRVTVDIDGRRLTLSNLDKPLYPTGFTKGEVIDYYSRIADTLLDHLTGRCITLKRFPDGVEADGFFEKRCPKHRPDWVDVARGPGDRRGGVDYCLLDERDGRIFVDWSQNAFHKTTIAPYSLRARPEPTVSTPVTWDEVESCAAGDVMLRFEAADVLRRVAEHGDLFAGVLTTEQQLPQRG